MKPSKQFISLPIVSLSEGQHIGYVKSLVIDARSKSIAALVVDPKGFFKDQRIIPYAKVVSIGEDAITIDKMAYVEKSASLPEILTLIKEKLSIIGTRVITETGKTLGVVEEFYLDPDDGTITQFEISGGKIEGFFSGKVLLESDYIITIGHDVIVAQKGCESSLMVADKGINDTVKSLIHSTSSLATETGQSIGKLFKRDKVKVKTKGRKHKSSAEGAPGDFPSVVLDENTLPPVEMASEEISLVQSSPIEENAPAPHMVEGNINTPELILDEELLQVASEPPVKEESSTILTT